MNEKEIKDLEEELDSLYSRGQEIRDKISKLKLQEINLDFTGKYIKYSNHGTTHYCYVDWVTKDTVRFGNFKYSYMIRGLGFSGVFSGYHDCTGFKWDYEYEFYIYSNSIDEFKEKVLKIEVIEESEFNNTLLECLEELKKYHEKYTL